VEARGEKEGRPKGFVVIRFTGDRMDVAHWTAGNWREHWSKSIGRPVRMGNEIRRPANEEAK
jgi:hypothetical protein